MVMYYRFRKYLGFSSVKLIKAFKIPKKSVFNKNVHCFSYNGRAMLKNQNKVFNNIL